MAFISALVSAGLEGVSTIFDRMFFTKCTEVTLDHFNEIFRCKDLFVIKQLPRRLCFVIDLDRSGHGMR